MNNILSIKPPREYQENIINIVEGMDCIPEYIDFISNGFTSDEANKMELLIRIELVKKQLEIAIDTDDLSEDDEKNINNAIKKMIEEYNNMVE